MFMTLNLNSTPCSVEADSRSCMGKQDNTGRINRKNRLNDFFPEVSFSNDHSYRLKFQSRGRIKHKLRKVH